MVKSFFTISTLALAVLAAANYDAPPPAEYKAPEPEYKAPEYKASEYEAPEYKAPDYKAPEYEAPEYKPDDTPAYDATTSSCTDDNNGYHTTSTDVYHVPDNHYTTPTYDDDYKPTDTPDNGYPVTTPTHDGGYVPDYETSSSCTTDIPTYTTAYTAVYTSCESYPTVYTNEGTVCSTDYSTTHYLTTEVYAHTPIETFCPTTITQDYETTYSTCLTYSTSYESSGTYYTTETTSYSYSTSTVCSTAVYTPVPPTYVPPTYVAPTKGVPTYAPPVGTGYPQPSYGANHTSYAAVPTYPVSTGGASSLAPSLIVFAAVFGGIVAAVF